MAARRGLNRRGAKTRAQADEQEPDTRPTVAGEQACDRMKRFALTVQQKSAEGKVGHAAGEDIDIEAFQKAERRSNR